MDPALATLLSKIFLYACCGSLVATVARWWHRDQPGPRLDQVAAIGALVGAGFGAVVGVFSAMMNRI